MEFKTKSLKHSRIDRKRNKEVLRGNTTSLLKIKKQERGNSMFKLLNLP